MRRALVAVVLAAALAPRPATAAQVTGVVLDPKGQPVEYATVAVPALRLGAVTDEQGRFTLDLPAGRAALDVMQVGYQRLQLTIAAGDSALALRIVLRVEPVPVAEVSVAASSFGKAGKGEGAVVRRREIMTTPGGTADIFQALRALPGINAPNEGAALYIRGGDPRETLIRVDDGDVGHPYHYEGASGGLFSALDSYMLKSAFFSSGGFSAKYGGVLSGVLDIQTQDPMNLRTVSVGANVVGGGASGSWLLVPDRLSLVGSLRWTSTSLLNRLYGTPEDYVSAPGSRDGIGRLIYRYSQSGHLSATWFDSHDEVGVIANRLNYEGTYGSEGRNQLGAVNVQDVVAGKLALRGQASLQRYDSQTRFGPVDLAQAERNAQANLDALWPLGTRHQLSFGANLRHRDTRITGVTLADSTDYQSGAPTRESAIGARYDYPGFYLEDKLRVWGPLYATVGGRMDYLSRPGVWTADPRAALAWRVDDRQTLRVAAGRYHQPADASFLDPVYGNPDLHPLRADHLIAGYEWLSEYGNIRVEGFRKDYRGLVAQDALSYYANTGFGYARGVDVFVQGTHRWLSGWISYGYLDSKRRELDDPREVPSAYGVRHSLTLVAQYQATSSLILGAKYNVASGRRYTPVAAATYDPSRNLWRPVYGDHHSAQLPTYQRLDLRMTRLFSLPAAGRLRESSTCVFYVEGLNVLGIRNPLEVVYGADYSRSGTTDSYFSRVLLVAGFSLSW